MPSLSHWSRRILPAGTGAKQASLPERPASSKKLEDLTCAYSSNGGWAEASAPACGSLAGEAAVTLTGSHQLSPGAVMPPKVADDTSSLSRGEEDLFSVCDANLGGDGRKITQGFRALLPSLALSWKLSHLSKHGLSVWTAKQCPYRGYERMWSHCPQNHVAGTEK